jgi:hypothetical protein
VVNAGKDTNYCINLDTIAILIGGNPTATGGTKPYYYEWVVYSKTTGTEISILSKRGEDHESNPAISPLELLSRKINDVLIAEVTVTDSVNTTASDNVIIGISCIKFKHLVLCGRIVRNDSVQLDLCNIDQGIEPFSYHWTPEKDISNPYIRNPMVKPDTTTAYFVMVTDSIGCSAEDEVTVWVEEETTIKDRQTKTEYIKFLGDRLYFSNELVGGTIQISSINGTIVYHDIIKSDHLDIPDIIKIKGVYLYQVVTGTNKVYTGKIMRNQDH